jgi:hypothetical protein
MKVRDHDAYACCYNNEDCEDEEEEAVHVVEFAIPKGSEYKVHLDIYASKGEKTSQRDDEKWL